MAKDPLNIRVYDPFLKPVPVPSVEPDDPENAPICVRVAPDWIPYLVGALWPLIYSDKWQGDDEDRQRGTQMAHNLMCQIAAAEPCLGDLPGTPGGCTEYRPEDATFITWSPNDPYQTPDLVPDGYDKPPWYSVPNTLPGGIDAGDALADLTSLDIDVGGTIFDIPQFIASITSIIGDTGLPRFRIHLSGTGICELHLLQVPQGGLGLITVDGDPTTAELISLQAFSLGNVLNITEVLGLVLGVAVGSLDLTPSTIKEVEITEPGDHFIDVTLIPNITIEFDKLGWGGGLKKVVLCGFDTPGEEGEMPQFRTQGCNLEWRPNGESAWETLLEGLVVRDGTCFFTAQVGIGIQQLAPDDKNLLIRPSADADKAIHIISPFSEDGSSIHFSSQGYDDNNNRIDQAFLASRIKARINADGASQITLAFQRQDDSSFVSGPTFGRLANGQLGFNLQGFAMGPPREITGDTYGITALDELLTSMLGNGLIAAKSTTNNLVIPAFTSGAQPTNTLPAGSSATVSYDPQTGELTFGIPAGAAGAAGADGATGPQGPQGVPGECPDDCGGGPDVPAPSDPADFGGTASAQCAASTGIVALLRNMWDDGWNEVKNAGTVLTVATIIFGLLFLTPLSALLAIAAALLGLAGASSTVDAEDTQALWDEILCKLYCLMPQSGLVSDEIIADWAGEVGGLAAAPNMAPVLADLITSAQLEEWQDAAALASLTQMNADCSSCDPCPVDISGCNHIVDFDSSTYPYEFNRPDEWSFVTGRIGSGAKHIKTDNRRCFSQDAGANPGWYREFVFVRWPPDCEAVTITGWIKPGPVIGPGAIFPPGWEIGVQIETETRIRVDTSGDRYASPTGNVDGDWIEWSITFTAQQLNPSLTAHWILLCIGQDAGGGSGPPVSIGYDGPTIDEIELTGV